MIENDLHKLMVETQLTNSCWNPIYVPGQEYPKRCENRRNSICAPCARLFKDDWRAIGLDGIFNEDGSPLDGYQFWFITLTMPSMGAVHNSVGAEGLCSHCQVKHDPDLIGVALRETQLLEDCAPWMASRFEASQQVQWHMGLTAGWDSTRKQLRRDFPDAAYFLSNEWQERAAIHKHILVRIPDSQALDYLSTYAKLEKLQGVKALDGAWQWGSQMKIDKLGGSDLKKKVGYVVKALGYGMKSITSDKHKDYAGGKSDARARQEHKLAQAARRTPCHKRGGCSDPASCSSRAHRADTVGFSGRPVVCSRDWSVSGKTRKSLKEKRLHYVLNSKDGGVRLRHNDELLALVYQHNMTTRRPDLSALPPPPLEELNDLLFGSAVEVNAYINGLLRA
ncbi:replication initiator [Nesterenkonia aerolata]|uniref:Replication protein n=1 Tax=Nesterenkonia aerolata TaxID=3074079 RepID=A0ABU2DSF7_9MICC|nr:replication initiator [Nesterenkonia sp. LY-0111]MDR8019418.1 hypothetical protein [Nesterenkonia sp. LY-0111]